MRGVLRQNGLSIILLSLFLLFWLGQSVAGHREHNSEQRDHKQPEVGYVSYLSSTHFWEATAENWESEFLQMFGYVILTAMLVPEGLLRVEEARTRRSRWIETRAAASGEDAPWPVRRGGLVLKLYENSLSLAFLLLLPDQHHRCTRWQGPACTTRSRRRTASRSTLSALQYAGTSRFWFESFQNWQSEFLAIAAMVVFSIFLRQRGSPESKPVDSPHGQTGTE